VSFVASSERERAGKSMEEERYPPHIRGRSKRRHIHLGELVILVYKSHMAGEDKTATTNT